MEKQIDIELSDIYQAIDNSLDKLHEETETLNNKTIAISFNSFVLVANIESASEFGKQRKFVDMNEVYLQFVDFRMYFSEPDKKKIESYLNLI